ncbi:fibroblast growth factor 18a isoform X2 [Oryzias latipes]
MPTKRRDDLSGECREKQEEGREIGKWRGDRDWLWHHTRGQKSTDSLCIQMLLVMCNPLQVLGVDGVNFSVHVENQTQVRDTMSRRHHRVYQLYSRTSGKHVQVLGRRISARGEDGDKYAQLVVEADTFGSQVRIRGKETNFYLCMNSRGKLVGKKASNRSADCVFVEKVLENHYTALMSARYTDWYVGFNKRGRPRPGSRTQPNQQDGHFMKRFPPGEQPDLTTPFRFTTISKRGNRVRANGPR